MGQLANTQRQRQMAQASQPQKGTLESIVRSNWHKIEAVAPRHLSSERMYQMTISAINHEPKLAECDVATLLSCVMKCSALGMEPSSVDGLGRAYILPFRNGKTRRMEATFILGYKGMIDLARRSGEIKDVSARAVYEGDLFEWEFGLDEKLRHVPSPTAERRPDALTHVYCIARFKDGGHYMDVMTKAEVDAIRKRSKAGASGPWVTDYEAMARKTVIRRAFPYLPVSVEAQSAAASDDTDGGFTNLFGGPEPVIGADQPIEADAEVEDAPRETEPVDCAEDEVHNCIAVCRTCGNVFELAVGQRPEDVRFMCCERPDYVRGA